MPEALVNLAYENLAIRQVDNSRVVRVPKSVPVVPLWMTGKFWCLEHESNRYCPDCQVREACASARENYEFSDAELAAFRAAGVDVD